MLSTRSLHGPDIGELRPVLDEPLHRVRSSFTRAFDEALPIEQRFLDLGSNGRYELAGIGLTSWTLLLHWRQPAIYPPFDRRTLVFVRDFHFAPYAPLSVTPLTYPRWIAFSQDLAQRLRLPSAGHVDRLVWEHTRDLSIWE